MSDVGKSGKSLYGIFLSNFFIFLYVHYLVKNEHIANICPNMDKNKLYVQYFIKYGHIVISCSFLAKNYN
jgi:hypothetical protein